MQQVSRRDPAKILPQISWETIAPPYLNYHYFNGSDAYPFRYNANLFDMVNAWWLIEASTLTYAPEDFVNEKFAGAGMTAVRYFSGPSTQCYVADNENFVIVAFRGTEIRADRKSDFKNIIADLQTDFEILLVDSGQGGRVHKGFKQALDEVWESGGLLDYIRSKDTPNRTIWFTGHSLGAALATLAADRYGKLQGLYTFGSPRVGDMAFKDDFYVNTYRFVNNNDLVARVPPPGLYHHVGELRYIDSKGVIHDNSTRWERIVDAIRGQALYVFNALGQIRSGFLGFTPDDIVDHVPTLYATHIWNNIQ